MRRLRLRLKNFSENFSPGRFRSKERSLVGFDLEEVRRLQAGDRPTSSSFDPLHSIVFKRYFLRIRRADRTARVLLAIDNTPSMRVGSSALTKRSFTLHLIEEMSEGLAEGSNEVGFLVWSRAVEEYLPPLSSVHRSRERLVMLDERASGGSPTEPAKLFEYLLRLPRRPSIVFVFSDWKDTTDFGEELKRCMSEKLDIVPVVICDSAEENMPWFLGNALFQSAESSEVSVLTGINGEVLALETFRALALPFVTLDVNAGEEETDKAFDEYFELRERERR